MQSVLFTGPNEVSLTSLADPTPASDEVVVAVKTSGICHTDFEVLKANYGSSAFPLVPGHEYAGIVAEIGSNVTGVKVGDRVAVDPNLNCGECGACDRGWVHLCEVLGAYGVTQNGGFSELSVVKAAQVHNIGDLTFKQAALAEPMGCSLNGVDAVFDTFMETGLIFGAGPMGLLLAIALRSRGLNNITFADIDDTRLEMAEDFGFKGIASGSAELKKLHHGVDLTVDATGVPAVAGDLINYTANGGKALFFGVCPSEARIEISPFEVFRRQITLAGSHSLNRNIPQALEAVKSGGLGIEKLVSHEMDLVGIAEIFKSHPPKGSRKIQAVFE